METHLCITWESSSGAATLFIDGKKSLTKIYKKGHAIRAGGKVLLGQDPDSYVSDFDANQSFVGEISDVNMWDTVLPDSVIRNVFSRKEAPRGNVFNWESTRLVVHGDVQVISRDLGTLTHAT